MLKHKYLLALFAAILYLSAGQSSAPAFAASDTPALASARAEAKAEAATLLQKGDANAAYDLYMRLLRESPEDDEISLGLARAAAGANRWHQSVMAYEVLIEKHPREAALYSELARVYMLADDREAAERSLAVMRSLDGQTTAADTGLALDDMERRYNRLQIHGKIRAGILYDSNANMGPKSEEMRLGDFPLPIKIPGAKEKETFGAYLGADLDLGYRIYQDSPWWIVGDVRAFWRGNANDDLRDLHSQESQWGRASAGVRHLTSKSLFDLRFKAEIFDYELYQNVSAIGPEATFLYALTPSVHLITRGGIDHREYSRDRHRNGTYGWAGEYLRLFFGSDNHEFMAGLRYLGAAADKTDYSYNGYEASAGFVFKLPYGFELGPNISFTQEFYKGPATVLETKDREDKRLRVGTLLTYRIDEAWSLELNYQYTNNDSKSNLYEYDQHLVTTGVAWSF
ncbi:MAG: surface lipoprotein assembly modifier [Desulfovibrio sp.]|jgi:hypothetical protein|nr:surface lipoprotein assembly modifier [Desulfovibrio sp.]